MKKLIFLFLFFISKPVHGQDTLGLILAKDTFELEVESSGCFHHSVTVYKYIKKGNLRTLSVYEIKEDPKPFLLYKVEVTENDLKVLKQYYERGLKKPSMGCTSEKRYFLSSFGLQSHYTDDTCEHSSMDDWRYTISRRKRL